MKSFLETVDEHQQVIQALGHIEDKIVKSAELLETAVQKAGKILLCGNGGSAADAQHLAAELIVRFRAERYAMPALALTTDTSVLTAHSNDYSFETVYSRQVEGLGRSEDVLIAITTSGNSENVCKAAQTAKKIGMKIIGLTGNDGGRIAALSDVPVIVPSNKTARIQETHILIAHWWCEYLEREYVN